MPYSSKFLSKQIPTSEVTGSKPNRPRPIRLPLLSALSGKAQCFLRFCRMTEEDLPGVAALELQCFSQPWSERVLKAELQNPNAVFCVAKTADRVVGYVGMHRVLDEGYIANVAVDQAFRRRGVATALLKRLLRFARRGKLCFLTLEVRESNQAAIAFYRGMGFGEVGRRKNFYANPTEDALLMTCFLPEKT